MWAKMQYKVAKQHVYCMHSILIHTFYWENVCYQSWKIFLKGRIIWFWTLCFRRRTKVLFFFFLCFDILRPVVTCLPCDGCLRWQEAGWLIKAWTALQTPLTHSWYCHEHHSYNTLAQESFPSVSPDVRARARAGERFADLCMRGHAQFHSLHLCIDSSR